MATPVAIMNVNVSVKRVSLVQGSEAEQLRETNLMSAIGHGIASIPYTNRVLFFKKRLSSLFEETVLQMKESISVALSHFYTLAGRISVREDGRMDLVCNNAGIKFIEAHCNMQLGAEDKFDLEVELLEKLCQAPGHDLKWPWPSDAPLLFVQVTEFSCGGFSLGLKYSHQLLDGTSLWHFVKSWSEISCGRPVSLLPDIVPDPIQIPHTSSLPPELPAGMMVINRNTSVGVVQPMPLLSKRFRFGGSQLAVLKKQHPGFTKFQLLSAHVWCSVTRARELKDEESSTLRFAINCRERSSSLSGAHLGCAIGVAYSTMTWGELKSASLEQVASRIKQATDAHTAEHWDMVNKVIAYYAGDPVSAASFCGGRGVTIGGSFNFPVYNEFGWGAPFDVAIVGSRVDGYMVYFPGREQGSIDAFITLVEKTMHRLEADASFLNL